MKTERGVMVIKDGKAWGPTYEDGRSSSCGWIDVESAPIHDPRFCKKTTDVTFKNSPDTAELLTAQLVTVERITNVRFI